MQKRKRSVVFFILMTLMCLLLLSGCSGDVLEELAELGAELDRSVTITDVRNQVPKALEEYSDEQITDLLFMLNDWKKGALADSDYYAEVCEELSVNNVKQFYAHLSSSEEQPEKNDDPNMMDNQDENGQNEDQTKVDNTDKERKPAKKMSFVLLLVGVIVFIIFVVVIIIVIVRWRKKGNHDSDENSKNNNNDDDDDDDDE